jgi:putative acetyltransferase
MEVTFRLAETMDLDEIAALFEHCVRTTLSQFYTPAQVELWALPASMPEFWIERMETSRFELAVVNGSPAGFCVMQHPGYIEMLYTGAGFQGKGIARELLARAEHQARLDGCHWLAADASLSARPVFEKCGFIVLKEQVTDVGGRPFVNCKMLKDLL